MPPPVTSRTTPLPALLSQVESAFVSEFDRRLADSEFCALSFAHARNVLRHLDAGPERPARLGELARVSKQAISQQLTHLEANGYVTVGPDPDDHRARVVRLTEKGAAAQQLVSRTFDDIERDWAVLAGDDGLTALRGPLERLLGHVSASPAAPREVRSECR